MHVANFAESARYRAAEPARGGADTSSSPCRACGRSSIPASPSRMKEGTVARPARLQAGDRARPQGQRPTSWRASRCRPGAAARAIGDWLVLKNIRVSMGLDRIRYAATGAAPISPDLISWYWALGIEHVRGLRPDRECGPRHLELSGSHQDRHHRRGGARHRAEAFGAWRDPAARPPHLHGLPQQAGEDRRGAARRLAAHRRRRLSRQRGLSCASPTA